MKYLSIVACLKDERLNIKEWIDFHLGVGVEHFYIYDNGSSDGSTEVLHPYIESGQVTYSYNTMDMCQLACYYNALTAYRDQSTWMAFIDLDEFLFAPGGDLKTRLKDFEGKHPGIAVNEVFFGSNGHETRPGGGVLRNYTKRGKEINKHVKTICQPQHTVAPAFNPHSFYYMNGNAVNELGEPCQGPFNEPGTADIFRINHYWVKSKEEYRNKLERGRADVPSRDPKFRYSQQGRDLEKVILQDNEVEDTEIWKFLGRDHG
tara:strand:- start:967 stop:1752 length:786 start_codon:yes stop_codon:yes gene_type:complete